MTPARAASSISHLPHGLTQTLQLGPGRCVVPPAIPTLARRVGDSARSPRRPWPVWPPSPSGSRNSGAHAPGAGIPRREPSDRDRTAASSPRHARVALNATTFLVFLLPSPSPRPKRTERLAERRGERERETCTAHESSTVDCHHHRCRRRCCCCCCYYWFMASAKP